MTSPSAAIWSAAVVEAEPASIQESNAVTSTGAMSSGVLVSRNRVTGPRIVVPARPAVHGGYAVGHGAAAPLRRTGRLVHDRYLSRGRRPLAERARATRAGPVPGGEPGRQRLRNPGRPAGRVAPTRRARPR